MKYIKRLLILVLLLSVNNVYAEDNLKLCTPTKDYKNYSSLSEKEKNKHCKRNIEHNARKESSVNSCKIESDIKYKQCACN